MITTNCQFIMNSVERTSLESERVSKQTVKVMGGIQDSENSRAMV